MADSRVGSASARPPADGEQITYETTHHPVRLRPTRPSSCLVSVARSVPLPARPFSAAPATAAGGIPMMPTIVAAEIPPSPIAVDIAVPYLTSPLTSPPESHADGAPHLSANADPHPAAAANDTPLDTQPDSHTHIQHIHTNTHTTIAHTPTKTPDSGQHTTHTTTQPDTSTTSTHAATQPNDDETAAADHPPTVPPASIPADRTPTPSFDAISAADESLQLSLLTALLPGPASIVLGDGAGDSFEVCAVSDAPIASSPARVGRVPSRPMHFTFSEVQQIAGEYAAQLAQQAEPTDATDSSDSSAVGVVSRDLRSPSDLHSLYARKLTAYRLDSESLQPKLAHAIQKQLTILTLEERVKMEKEAADLQAELDAREARANQRRDAREQMRAEAEAARIEEERKFAEWQAAQQLAAQAEDENQRMARSRAEHQRRMAKFAAIEAKARADKEAAEAEERAEQENQAYMRRKVEQFHATLREQYQADKNIQLHSDVEEEEEEDAAEEDDEDDAAIRLERKKSRNGSSAAQRTVPVDDATSAPLDASGVPSTLTGAIGDESDPTASPAVAHDSVDAIVDEPAADDATPVDSGDPTDSDSADPLVRVRPKKKFLSPAIIELRKNLSGLPKIQDAIRKLWELSKPAKDGLLKNEFISFHVAFWCALTLAKPDPIPPLTDGPAYHQHPSIKFASIDWNRHCSVRDEINPTEDGAAAITAPNVPTSPFNARHTLTAPNPTIAPQTPAAIIAANMATNANAAAMIVLNKKRTNNELLAVKQKDFDAFVFENIDACIMTCDPHDYLDILTRVLDHISRLRRIGDDEVERVLLAYDEVRCVPVHRPPIRLPMFLAPDADHTLASKADVTAAQAAAAAKRKKARLRAKKAGLTIDPEVQPSDDAKLLSFLSAVQSTDLIESELIQREELYLRSISLNSGLLSDFFLIRSFLPDPHDRKKFLALKWSMLSLLLCEYQNLSYKRAKLGIGPNGTIVGGIDTIHTLGGGETGESDQHQPTEVIAFSPADPFTMARLKIQHTMLKSNNKHTDFMSSIADTNWNHLNRSWTKVYHQLEHSNFIALQFSHSKAIRMFGPKPPVDLEILKEDQENSAYASGDDAGGDYFAGLKRMNYDDSDGEYVPSTDSDLSSDFYTGTETETESDDEEEEDDGGDGVDKPRRRRRRRRRTNPKSSSGAASETPKSTAATQPTPSTNKKSTKKKRRKASADHAKGAESKSKSKQKVKKSKSSSKATITKKGKMKIKIDVPNTSTDDDAPTIYSPAVSRVYTAAERNAILAAHRKSRDDQLAANFELLAHLQAKKEAAQQAAADGRTTATSYTHADETALDNLLHAIEVQTAQQATPLTSEEAERIIAEAAAAEANAEAKAHAEQEETDDDDDDDDDGDDSASSDTVDDGHAMIAHRMKNGIPLSLAALYASSEVEHARHRKRHAQQQNEEEHFNDGERRANKKKKGRKARRDRAPHEFDSDARSSVATRGRTRTRPSTIAPIQLDASGTNSLCTSLLGAMSAVGLRLESEGRQLLQLLNRPKDATGKYPPCNPSDFSALFSSIGRDPAGRAMLVQAMIAAGCYTSVEIIDLLTHPDCGCMRPDSAPALVEKIRDSLAQAAAERNTGDSSQPTGGAAPVTPIDALIYMALDHAMRARSLGDSSSLPSNSTWTSIVERVLTESSSVSAAVLLYHLSKHGIDIEPICISVGIDPQLIARVNAQTDSDHAARDQSDHTSSDTSQATDSEADDSDLSSEPTHAVEYASDPGFSSAIGNGGPSVADRRTRLSRRVHMQVDSDDPVYDVGARSDDDHRRGGRSYSASRIGSSAHAAIRHSRSAIKMTPSKDTAKRTNQHITTNTSGTKRRANKRGGATHLEPATGTLRGSDQLTPGGPPLKELGVVVAISGQPPLPSASSDGLSVVIDGVVPARSPASRDGLKSRSSAPTSTTNKGRRATLTHTDEKENTDSIVTEPDDSLLLMDSACDSIQPHTGSAATDHLRISISPYAAPHLRLPSRGSPANQQRRTNQTTSDASAQHASTDHLNVGGHARGEFPSGVTPVGTDFLGSDGGWSDVASVDHPGSSPSRSSSASASRSVLRSTSHLALIRLHTPHVNSAGVPLGSQAPSPARAANATEVIRSLHPANVRLADGRWRHWSATPTQLAQAAQQAGSGVTRTAPKLRDMFTYEHEYQDGQRDTPNNDHIHSLLSGDGVSPARPSRVAPRILLSSLSGHPSIGVPRLASAGGTSGHFFGPAGGLPHGAVYDIYTAEGHVGIGVMYQDTQPGDERTERISRVQHQPTKQTDTHYPRTPGDVRNAVVAARFHDVSDDASVPPLPVSASSMRMLVSRILRPLGSSHKHVLVEVHDVWGLTATRHAPIGKRHEIIDWSRIIEEKALHEEREKVRLQQAESANALQRELDAAAIDDAADADDGQTTFLTGDNLVDPDARTRPAHSPSRVAVASLDGPSGRLLAPTDVNKKVSMSVSGSTPVVSSGSSAILVATTQFNPTVASVLRTAVTPVKTVRVRDQIQAAHEASRQRNARHTLNARHTEQLLRSDLTSIRSSSHAAGSISSQSDRLVSTAALSGPPIGLAAAPLPDWYDAAHRRASMRINNGNEQHAAAGLSAEYHSKRAESPDTVDAPDRTETHTETTKAHQPRAQQDLQSPTSSSSSSSLPGSLLPPPSVRSPLPALTSPPSLESLSWFRAIVGGSPTRAKNTALPSIAAVTATQTAIHRYDARDDTNDEDGIDSWPDTEERKTNYVNTGSNRITKAINRNMPPNTPYAHTVTTLNRIDLRTGNNRSELLPLLHSASDSTPGIASLSGAHSASLVSPPSLSSSPSPSPAAFLTGIEGEDMDLGADGHREHEIDSDPRYAHAYYQRSRSTDKQKGNNDSTPVKPIMRRLDRTPTPTPTKVAAPVSHSHPYAGASVSDQRAQLRAALAAGALHSSHTNPPAHHRRTGPGVTAVGLSRSASTPVILASGAKYVAVTAPTFKTAIGPAHIINKTTGTNNKHKTELR